MFCKLGTKPLRVCSVQTIFGLGDALSLMASERLTVEQWLKSIHFGEYCTKFEVAGYNDLSFLVKRTDAEVNEMRMSVQMTKGGHGLKLMKAFADLRSQIQTHQERQKEQQTPTQNRLKPKQQSSKYAFQCM